MHGGFEIAPDNELNGITFGGVGSGTTVEYVQVHKTQTTVLSSSVVQ